MEAQFFVERTRSGRPAMWESGGGLSNTGHAVIITSYNGSAKKPIYIKKKGHLSCGEHALFIVHPGDHVVIAARRRDEYHITVYQIEEINESAVCNLLYIFDREWVDCKEGTSSPDCPAEFEAAVTAAKEKMQCYHCRAPHFISD